MRGRLVVVLLLLAGPLAAQSRPTDARLDQLFASASGAAPGCALGVDSAGVGIIRRAWGMANLELGVPATPTTIFEAGSVSKQVTAAAVHLLAARGQIGLGDDIRRWFPELPGYDAPITITHLLQHTSGLRDWGAIAELQGWPRGSRILEHRHVLDLIARQRGLNHEVGAAYSYTNSGYSLLAMLVERVSGVSLAEFTRREFFEPLGMTHTSWRDDFARVVPGRAQAYARRDSTWRLDMPFENPHGHGGLLTTIDDLLRWNAAMSARRLGTPDVSAAMEVRGTLRDGTAISYAGGLAYSGWGGVEEIGHSGATAGYRAHLARWPSLGISAVVLCGNASANATVMLRQAVQPLVFKEPVVTTATMNTAITTVTAPWQPDTADYVGTWHSGEADARWTIAAVADTLVLARTAGERVVLGRMEQDRFRAGSLELAFQRDTSGRISGLLVSIPRARNVSFQRVVSRGS
ncbi:MAG TPA: serine hydrolase domain-containing protein [Gemmatimonadales bacterium]|nr:serine hydrolase domain-containing protein [Gemmatimonadales bacterium]